MGEFISEEQVIMLAESLRRLRNRPADVDYSDELCSQISDKAEIRNRYIPRKLLRKDEASVLFYNLAPYALIGRKKTAQFAKRAFPNFFASIIFDHLLDFHEVQQDPGIDIGKYVIIVNNAFP